MTLYPWQTKLFEQFQFVWTENRLAHAILLTGDAGLGKKDLAEAFAKTILCHAGNACNLCHSCQLFTAGNHPDLHRLTVEDDAHAIKIEQIRFVTQVLSEKPQLQSYRVVIIESAEAMNRSSANALLKTLEEPGEKTLLLLLSDRPHLLLPTIRSRCEAWHLEAPENQTALIWLQQEVEFPKNDLELALKLAQGGPLLARDYLQNDLLADHRQFLVSFEELYEDKLNLSKMAEGLLKKNDLKIYIQWWLLQLTSVLCHIAIEDKKESSFWYDIVAQVNPRELYRFYDQLIAAKKILEESSVIQVQLLLETLLISWSQLMTPLKLESLKC